MINFNFSFLDKGKHIEVTVESECGNYKKTFDIKKKTSNITLRDVLLDKEVYDWTNSINTKELKYEDFFKEYEDIGEFNMNAKINGIEYPSYQPMYVDICAKTFEVLDPSNINVFNDYDGMMVDGNVSKKDFLDMLDTYGFVIFSSKEAAYKIMSMPTFDTIIAQNAVLAISMLMSEFGEKAIMSVNEIIEDHDLCNLFDFPNAAEILDMFSNGKRKELYQIFAQYATPTAPAQEQPEKEQNIQELLSQFFCSKDAEGQQSKAPIVVVIGGNELPF